ncbi:MAG: hypothetical protein JOY98_07270 [Candidatus Eremiobacteraeota bacterium]|nr:hypothetical protein [Candidatus Eremiobacteraeota bacterium]
MHVVVLALATFFTAVRAPHPLALDPSLSDPAWALGEIRTGSFWNLTKRSAAQLATRVYLLYDDRNLYVAFRAEQQSVPIVAGQTTNNVGFGQDDFVGVAIDTSGAANQVYFFETTPRGIRYQQASDNARYTPRWRSAVRVENGSWNAVMIVPLAIVRLSRANVATWRFNFIRSLAAVGEHYTWAYDGLMNDGTVGSTWPTFGDAKYWPSLKIDGIAGAARPQPHLDIYGLGSAGADRNLFQQANGTFGPQTARWAGIDATIPLTGTINLVTTVNPDFSNVEVDQLTIAPQEFQRQLTEYRPFFAQGASFLSPSQLSFSSPTGPNTTIFYTPRIGPFDWGAKVEGTFGLQSFGVLTFRGFDETTGNTFDDTAYGYQHALPDRTFQYWLDGVVAHHSMSGSDDTTDFGVLWRDPKTGLQSGTGDTLEYGSWVPNTGMAHADNSYVGLFKPNYTLVLGYNDNSPNYNPIDGLTFNSDIKGFQGFAGAQGKTAWTKNYSIGFNFDRWFDRSGAVHEADTLTTLSAVFKNGISINTLGPSIGTLRSYDVPAGPGCGGPTIGTTSFTGFPCYRNGQDQRYNLFTTAIGYKDGTPQPFDVSYAFGPFGGKWTQLFTVATSRPLGRFSIALQYDGTYERAFATGVLDSQFLRSISVGRSLGPESNVSVALQNINGIGGFATQTGTNVAFGYHQRFADGNELYVNYGTPASYRTLDRFIAKYVLHIGGDAGT